MSGIVTVGIVGQFLVTKRKTYHIIATRVEFFKLFHEKKKSCTLNLAFAWMSRKFQREKVLFNHQGKCKRLADWNWIDMEGG